MIHALITYQVAVTLAVTVYGLGGYRKATARDCRYGYSLYTKVGLEAL